MATISSCSGMRGAALAFVRDVRAGAAVVPPVVDLGGRPRRFGAGAVDSVGAASLLARPAPASSPAARARPGGGPARRSARSGRRSPCRRSPERARPHHGERHRAAPRPIASPARRAGRRPRRPAASAPPGGAGRAGSTCRLHRGCSAGTRRDPAAAVAVDRGRRSVAAGAGRSRSSPGRVAADRAAVRWAGLRRAARHRAARRPDGDRVVGRMSSGEP